MKRMVLVFVAWAVAGEECPAAEVLFGGQFRPRFEFANPSAGPYDSFTSMRVRVEMSAKLEQDVNVLVQLQDIRLWGEEGNTLGDFRADNFDLHQAYVDLQAMHGSKLSARIGRQAISFGGQRLIGAVDWTQQGRVFDGLRFGAKARRGEVDVIGIRLADATAPGIAASAYLAGFYVALRPAKAFTLDTFTFYDKVSDGVHTDQVTTGLRVHGRNGALSYRAEGAYQTGDRNGQAVSAFMLGARAGRALGRGQVTLWYDYLSGDDDAADGRTKVFHTLFATNHKFYGYADVFLDIPLHTGGLGLQDTALKTSIAPGSRVTLSADVHVFRSARREAGTGSHRLGEEIDLTVDYGYSPNVSFTAGYSRVVAGDAIKAIGRLSDDLSVGYFMTNVSF